MNVLAIVPARGGSKAIPRKNLASVGARPLIAWTADAAMGSKLITRAIVSTDDQEIADVAGACGLEVPFLRPAYLALDDTPMLPVVEHALGELGEFDVVVVLQPTSPLRESRHIDEALALIRDHVDTVVSVVAVPHRYSEGSLMRVRADGLLEPPDPNASFRRQDKEQLFARNGPAVLATRAAVIRGGSLYGAAVAPYVMGERESIDVDTLFDLEIADLLLSQGGHRDH